MNLCFKDICNDMFYVVIVVKTTLHYISFLHGVYAEAPLKSGSLFNNGKRAHDSEREQWEELPKRKRT